eukprot:TRINITY_DN6144_c0_g2_i1.p1 TRINITY_DN6144_c0_g2~~TRINITY_DN6144_c0_g2_i1.p1  ORF type:complete len:2681 (+),score=723.60 TRINITY_DN6144_c0_g2_i1:101-8143(+)
MSSAREPQSAHEALRIFWGGRLPQEDDSAAVVEEAIANFKVQATRGQVWAPTDRAIRKLVLDVQTKEARRHEVTGRKPPREEAVVHLARTAFRTFMTMLQTDSGMSELFVLNETGPEALAPDAGKQGERPAPRLEPFSVPVPAAAAESERFRQVTAGWIQAQCASLGLPCEVSVAPPEPPPPQGCAAAAGGGDGGGGGKRKKRRRKKSGGGGEQGTSSAASTPASKPLQAPLPTPDEGVFARLGDDGDRAAAPAGLVPLRLRLLGGLVRRLHQREAAADKGLKELSDAVERAAAAGTLLAVPNPSGWAAPEGPSRVDVLKGDADMLARAHSILKVLHAPKDGRWSYCAVPASLLEVQNPRLAPAAEGEGAAEASVRPHAALRPGDLEDAKAAAAAAAGKVHVVCRCIGLPPGEVAKTLRAVVASLARWFPDTSFTEEVGADGVGRVLCCGLGAEPAEALLSGKVVFRFPGGKYPGCTSGLPEELERRYGCSVAFGNEDGAPDGAAQQLAPDQVNLRASSEDASHPARNVLDGSDATFWESKSDRPPDGSPEQWHWLEVSPKDGSGLARVELVSGGHSARGESGSWDPDRYHVTVSTAEGKTRVIRSSCKLYFPHERQTTTLLRAGEAREGETTLRVGFIAKGMNLRVRQLLVFGCGSMPSGKGSLHVAILGADAVRESVLEALEAERRQSDCVMRVPAALFSGLTPQARLLRQHTGLRKAEATGGVLKLLGTRGPDGTLASARRAVARLVRHNGALAQRRRMTALRSEIASSIGHIRTKVRVPERLRQLLSLPAFARAEYPSQSPAQRPGERAGSRPSGPLHTAAAAMRSEQRLRDVLGDHAARAFLHGDEPWAHGSGLRGTDFGAFALGPDRDARDELEELWGRSKGGKGDWGIFSGKGKGDMDWATRGLGDLHIASRKGDGKGGRDHGRSLPQSLKGRHHMFSEGAERERGQHPENQREDIAELWAQVESFAKEVVGAQILQPAGVELADGWAATAAAASMHGGLRKGDSVSYRSGRLWRERIVENISTGVRSDGRPSGDSFLQSCSDWVAATLVGDRPDPGRPSLARIDFSGGDYLVNAGTRNLQKGERAASVSGVRAPARRERRDQPQGLEELAVRLIGLQWAALADEFLLGELESKLLHPDQAEPTGRSAYNMANRARHRVREMMNAAHREVQSVVRDIAAFRERGCKLEVKAAGQLSDAASGIQERWRRSLQQSEFATSLAVADAVRAGEAVQAPDARGLRCWDLLEQAGNETGAFISYNPPDHHVHVEGREKAVRTAVRRLQDFFQQDGVGGGTRVECSIDVPSAVLAELENEGALLLASVQLQSGLRQLRLSEGRIVARGTEAQVLDAARLLGGDPCGLPHSEMHATPSELFCRFPSDVAPGMGRALSASGMDADEVCVACWEGAQEDSDMRTLLCGHAVHSECMRKCHEVRAASAREVGKIEAPRCPVSADTEGAGGCRHKLTPSEVATLLGGGPAVVDALVAASEAQLRSHRDARQCPRCSAWTAVGIPGLPLVCPDCNLVYCSAPNSHCGLRPHYFSSCAGFARARAARASRDAGDAPGTAEEPKETEELWPADIVPCARCHCPISRQDGANETCKYMNCRLCGYQFCWPCLQAAEDHKHLNPAGCDNADGQNPEGREARRQHIISAAESGVGDGAAPLPPGMVVCDGCGGRTRTGEKVFVCLECMSSFLCAECEPSGCPESPEHVIAEAPSADSVAMQQTASAVAPEFEVGQSVQYRHYAGVKVRKVRHDGTYDLEIPGAGVRSAVRASAISPNDQRQATLREGMRVIVTDEGGWVPRHPLAALIGRGAEDTSGKDRTGECGTVVHDGGGGVVCVDFSDHPRTFAMSSPSSAPDDEDSGTSGGLRVYRGEALRPAEGTDAAESSGRGDFETPPDFWAMFASATPPKSPTDSPSAPRQISFASAAPGRTVRLRPPPGSERAAGGQAMVCTVLCKTGDTAMVRWAPSEAGGGAPDSGPADDLIKQAWWDSPEAEVTAAGDPSSWAHGDCVVHAAHGRGTVVGVGTAQISVRFAKTHRELSAAAPDLVREGRSVGETWDLFRALTGIAKDPWRAGGTADTLGDSGKEGGEREVATLLRVEGGPEHPELQGIYELVRGKMVNGRHVWRSADGANWIYANTGRRWCISPHADLKGGTSFGGVRAVVVAACYDEAELPYQVRRWRSARGGHGHLGLGPYSDSEGIRVSPDVVPANCGRITEWTTVGIPDVAVSAGKVMWEFTVFHSSSSLQVGWAATDFERATGYSQTGCGDDDRSWAVDGRRRQRFHGDSSGKPWTVSWVDGDVVGVAADLEAGALWFARNGEWGKEYDISTSGWADSGRGLYPCFSGKDLLFKANFGGTPAGFRFDPPDPSFVPLASVHPAACLSALTVLRGEKASLYLGAAAGKDYRRVRRWSLGASVWVVSPSCLERRCIVRKVESERVLLHYEGFEPCFDEWLTKEDPRMLGIQADWPTGNYMTVNDGDTAVSRFAEIDWSGASDIGQLESGRMVEVVEVRSVEQDKRIRARIRSPEGWISLTDTESGYVWALPMQDLEEADEEGSGQSAASGRAEAAAAERPAAGQDAAKKEAEGGGGEAAEGAPPAVAGADGAASPPAQEAAGGAAGGAGGGEVPAEGAGAPSEALQMGVELDGEDPELALAIALSQQMGVEPPVDW